MHDPPFGISQITSKYISSANKIVFLQEKQLNLMLLLKNNASDVSFSTYFSLRFSSSLPLPKSHSQTDDHSTKNFCF